MVVVSSPSALFRVVLNAERLALQESYFTSMHSLAPYFVELCFDRLSSVYVSPIEMKQDVEFFDCCTVSLPTLTNPVLTCF